MAQVFREAKMIVWDECTMAHKRGIKALNRMLKDIRGHNQLVGGVTVLLACDFRQILPVVLRGARADKVKAYLKSSILWSIVKILSLRINMHVYLQRDLRA
ncbi:hypothetical protein AVEN_177571-1 [Araneus ventricosus]|uniref:ATP-dependent DNA helicase n=1 Tax=Araneus ventricosus TaxID=182803 RepID=A0A4Y2MHE6_ARAVE|nr:hypothetical protein AVEN_177571-1 [Araneus ventricosus]